MAFNELSALTGEDIREVPFDIHQADIGILKQIDGFLDCNTETETLHMIKPIYGLPHEVSVQWLSCKQVYIEPGLHVVHGYLDYNNNWSRGPKYKQDRTPYKEL